MTLRPITAIFRRTMFIGLDETPETIISIQEFESVEALRAYEKDLTVWQEILLVFDVRNGAVIDGDLVRIARATGWR